MFANALPAAPADKIHRQLAGGELGALQLFGGLFRFLERLLLHQVEGLLIGHVEHVQADVQNRVGNHPQFFFGEGKRHFRRAAQETFVEHRLGRILAPAFDVSAVAKHRSQHAPALGLYIVGDLHLHIVAGHGFVDGEQLELVIVVFAQLGVRALLGPVRGNGRDPVESAQPRFERRRGRKTAHGIDAAHELGRRNHLEIRSRRKRQQVLLLDEGARFGQILACVVHIGFARGMALRDLGQHLADYLVLAGGARKFGVVLVRRRQVPVERQGQLEHLRTHAYQLALGHLQHGVGFGPAFQGEPELAHVPVARHAPAGIIAPGEVVLEKTLELAHGVQRRQRSQVVNIAQVPRHGGPDGLVHQVDVALVLFHRHLDPYVGRGGQVRAGLVEVERRLLQSRDNVAHARRLGRILQNVWAEQRVPQRLHIKSGVVQMAVQLVQVQQSQRNLILQNVQIGLVLGRESFAVERVQLRAKVFVIMPLPVEILRTCVVQQVVEILVLVVVQSHAGRHGGREGKRGVDKLIREAGEPIGRTTATAGREQNDGKDDCS